uniref:Reverse transcriptase domain-containing protein n=1 Tax=Oryza brachyantha TaxID=4533 RepID=J3NES6_ORYBR
MARIQCASLDPGGLNSAAAAANRGTGSRTMNGPAMAATGKSKPELGNNKCSNRDDLRFHLIRSERILEDPDTNARTEFRDDNLSSLSTKECSQSYREDEDVWWIALVAQNVIRPSQTTFLKERNIMEGAIILHETLHEMHRKKLDGVILKLDFEKAYDKDDTILFMENDLDGANNLKMVLGAYKKLSGLKINFHKSVLKKLDYYRSRFFWQCDEYKKKYRLARWSVLCPKTIGDSHFWAGLMTAKEPFQTLGHFIVNNGKQVIFKATQLTRLWPLLFKEDEGEEVIAKCKLLEKRMMELFSTSGWNFRRRIET